jgi:myosin-5
VLKFLASNSAAVAADLDDVALVVDVESVISAVNPITESFGNAKTSRNNNSSRFGKFIELEYVADGYIASAHIQTYLLETVRVTSQLKGERNYHIFYEIFAGMSAAKREEWGCGALQDFRLVNQSGEYSRHDGESDGGNFDRLVNAFQTIDTDEYGMEEIFKTVIGILHIGNLSFQTSSSVGADAAEFAEACRGSVASVCQLLGVPEARLEDAVCTRCIRVAGSLIKKQLSAEAAAAARDVLAKATYELMFKSIMVAVNRSLQFTEEEVDRVSFIGVLDIFGFEFFEHNSFEQLCINYANEKLQDHFNYAIFQSEKEVYEEEGVKWNFTDYPDNSERLELFEHKSTGLFLLCDEQLKIPKPSDEKLVQSFYAKCSSYKHFTASKSDRGKMEFVVNHFACDVKYKAPGFVEKNRNDIAQEIFECYQSSDVPFLQGFLAASGHESHSPTARRRSERGMSVSAHRESESGHAGAGTPQTHHKTALAVRKKTSSLASQFSRQLYELIAKIRSTRSHFVRCIKPNNQLLANTFDYEMVMNQLRCGGALGAVQVFRAGFPNRMDFRFFVSRYSAFLVLCGVNALTKDLYNCLLRARESGSGEMWKQAASMLVDIVSMTVVILNMSEEAEIAGDTDILSGLQMGRTQMFLRVPVFELLERLHVRSMNVIARRLQRRVRGKQCAAGRAGAGVDGNGGSGSRHMASECVMLFAFRRRVKARRCVSATILLQRRLRVYLAQSMRRRAVRGMSRLKAVFRGGKARRRVKLIRFTAASVIQANFRKFAAFSRFKEMKMSSILIQRVARMSAAVCAKKIKLKLILDLQCLWRGTQARIRTWAVRQKLKQAKIESQKRAAETKADFMTNLDDKLKSNPNLLFDMLGATEKIAVLSRQNELLLQTNRQLEQENIDLRRGLNSAEQQLQANARAMHSMRENSNSSNNNSNSSNSNSSNSNSNSDSHDNSNSNNSNSAAAATPLKAGNPQAEAHTPERPPLAPAPAAAPAVTPAAAAASPAPVTSPISSMAQTPTPMAAGGAGTVAGAGAGTGTGAGTEAGAGTGAGAGAGSTDFCLRVLESAREGAAALYHQLGAAKEHKAEVSAELTASHAENKRLKALLLTLGGGQATAAARLETLSTFLAEPKDDSAAQLLAVDNQIQIMQKRKAALVRLLGSLQENRSSFFEADINGAMEALSEIDSKLAELCAAQQTLSKAPIRFTELTHASEKEGVVKAVMEVDSLEASVSLLAEEIRSVTQQQTLADLGAREMKLKHAAAIEACDALEGSLRVVQDVIRQLGADRGAGQRARGPTLAAGAAPPPAQSPAGSSGHSPMNELITGRVKEKLSSVRGMMGRMSIAGFSSGDFGLFGSPSTPPPAPASAPTSAGAQARSQSQRPSPSLTPAAEHSNVDSGDFTTSMAPSPPSSSSLAGAMTKEKWNPDFIGSVGAWARSGKRDVTFIISVRAVDAGSVAEWTVTRSFNDFKALRQNIKCDNAGG